MNIISTFDISFEQALFAIRDPSTVQFFIWISKLGNQYVILALTLAVAIVLAYRKRWPLITGLFACVGGSAVSAYILKELIARPRPDISMQAYTASSMYSLPSIHATFAIAFYVFVLWLMYDTLLASRRRFAIASVAIIALAIGFSRLYLGVHFPSDVLAGYLLGGIFVLIGIKCSRLADKFLLMPSKNSLE